MGMVTLEVPESLVLEWVQNLSIDAKQSVLRVLIPHLDQLEALVEYASKQARNLCAKRGLIWDDMSEKERLQIIDELIHYS